MANFYLILTLYYIAVITGIFLHRYFARFIASDFANNRSLKIKRRWGIAYFYGVGFWSMYMIRLTGDIAKILNQDIFTFSVIVSIGIITLWYCHIIFSLEVPKKHHKKRKWK